MTAQELSEIECRRNALPFSVVAPISEADAGRPDENEKDFAGIRYRTLLKDQPAAGAPQRPR
jgi:hypothetical protein